MLIPERNDFTSASGFQEDWANSLAVRNMQPRASSNFDCWLSWSIYVRTNNDQFA